MIVHGGEVNIFTAPRQDQRRKRCLPSCDGLHPGTGDIQIGVFPGSEIRASRRARRESSGERIASGEGVKYAIGQFVLPPREITLLADRRNLGL